MALFIMEKIGQCVNELWNLWPHHFRQTIQYYTSLFLQLFAIFILVTIVAYAAKAILHRKSNSYRQKQLVSLCDLSPGFITQRDTSEPVVTSLVGKLFYTLMDGDDVAPEEACGIESTLKSNPNTTCYIMIFTPTTSSILKHMTENKREIYTLIDKYDHAVLLNVEGKRFFGASPLFNLWKYFKSNSNLIQFAARVLTLWHFGGTTYDSHLLTLKNDSMSALSGLMDTAVIDLNHGLIMSANQQCNGFLFEVVKVLVFVGQGMIAETSESKVLFMAVVRFCGKVQTTSNNGSVALELACAGVTGLPPGLLCYTNQSAPGCTWSYSRRNASDSVVQCPVTTIGVHGVIKEMNTSIPSHHRRTIVDL